MTYPRTFLQPFRCKYIVIDGDLNPCVIDSDLNDTRNYAHFFLSDKAYVANKQEYSLITIKYYL